MSTSQFALVVACLGACVAGLTASWPQATPKPTAQPMIRLDKRASSFGYFGSSNFFSSTAVSSQRFGQVCGYALGETDHPLGCAPGSSCCKNNLYKVKGCCAYPLQSSYIPTTCIPSRYGAASLSAHSYNSLAIYCTDSLTPNCGTNIFPNGYRAFNCIAPGVLSSMGLSQSSSIPAQSAARPSSSANPFTNTFSRPSPSSIPSSSPTRPAPTHPPTHRPSTTHGTSKGSQPNVGAIAGGTVAGVAVAALLVVALCLARRRRKQKRARTAAAAYAGAGVDKGPMSLQGGDKDGAAPQWYSPSPTTPPAAPAATGFGQLYEAPGSYAYAPPPQQPYEVPGSFAYQPQPPFEAPGSYAYQPHETQAHRARTAGAYSELPSGPAR